MPLSPEDIQTITEVVQNTVKVTVNGKIDRIDFKVEAQGKLLTEHIAEHKRDREEMQPVIDTFKGKSFIYKQLMAYMLPLGAFGGLMAGVAEFIHLLISKN